MFVKLFVNELKIYISSYRIILFSLFCIVLIPLASILMLNDYKQRMNEFELMTSENKELLKPNKLSVIAKGIDGEMYSTNENPLFFYFMTPDILFIVNIILSLLAILFGALSISEDKNNGILKLLMSHAILKYQIIVSKSIAGVISLIYPLLISFIIAIIIFVNFGGIHFDSNDLLKICLIFILFVLYLFIFFNIGLLISSLFYNSYVNSIYVAFTFWVIFVFFIPNFGLIVIKSIVNIPSVQQVEYEKNRLAQELAIRERSSINFSTEEILKRQRELDSMRDNRIDLSIDYAKTSIGLLPSGLLSFSITSLTETGVELFSINWKNWIKGNDLLKPKSLGFTNTIKLALPVLVLFMIYILITFIFSFVTFVNIEIF